MTDKNYVVYHLHSDYSNGVTNIDSVTKFDAYIKYASGLGMKALAFSEHGSVYSWVKKKETIEKAGMKYIHAEEFYVTETLEEKIRDNKHLVMIAKNHDGVKELNRLSSKAFNRKDGHYYYNPRITLNDVLNTSDNIIICTACLGGILNNSSMKDIFIKFLVKNKHRCFLEIQHHNVGDQIEYNKYLYSLHKKYDIPMIAGTDTHYLNNQHEKGRKILQLSKNIEFDNEDGWDLSFKSYDELLKSYQKQNSLPMDIVVEAIDNTNKMADMVEEFELDHSYKYPHLWENSEKYILKKIKQGIKKRGVDKFPNRQEYADRIKYELETYKHNGAIDFMLLMEDIISWSKENGIQTGYGRGSCNGSVVAWILGITEMDSIKHGLNFERFMNKERVSLADIDTDFPPSRIKEVKEYIFNKDGLYCSDIITFNTIADKGAIKDVCRALNKDLDFASKLCDCVDDEEEYAKAREKYPEIFEYVDIVKGVIVSVGNHPCGMITSPYPLDDSIGLCSTATDDVPISQIYMKEVDSLNFVKLDLLKLDTIELISNVCEMANIPIVLPEDLDINDDGVWNSMRDDTTCIFQWEGGTGDSYIKKLLSDKNIENMKSVNENVDKMTLLSIGNSAIRPAGASYREDLASGVVRKTGSKPIDDFLSDTFGYLVFQCQIIDFLHLYCGFTMGEADIVRRGFAKKTGTEQFIPIIKNGGYLTENSTHYIDGYIKTMKERYGIEESKSEEDIVAFIQVIVDASLYLFSNNHSEPYSYMGYAEGYLRYYYPVEFITCALDINKGNEEKTLALTNYAKKVSVNIVNIKFRHSNANYTCDSTKRTIYKGIQSIKFMNEKVANELYELRNNAYDNFILLLKDIKELTSLNSKQLDILIRLDFFSEFGDINYLLKCVDLFNNINGKKQFKKDKLFELSISEDIVKEFAGKETEKMFTQVDTDGLLSRLCNNIMCEKTTIVDRLANEIELLGYCTSIDPTASPRLYMATKVEVLKSIVNIELYGVKNGDTQRVKVWRKSYDRDLSYVKDGTIGYLSVKKDNKKEWDGTINEATGKRNYVPVPNEYEFWLKGMELYKE